MSGSQLEVEYADMADRHELYAKFGITAEAAQLFETELGTLLLALKGLENDWHIAPDGVAAQKALSNIDRSTLGRLLNDLKRHITIGGTVEECFSSALDSRNRLMHGFFERHNFKIQTADGRRHMIDELDALHRELFAAWRAAGKLTTVISAVAQQGAANRSDAT